MESLDMDNDNPSHVVNPDQDSTDTDNDEAVVIVDTNPSTTADDENTNTTRVTTENNAPEIPDTMNEKPSSSQLKDASEKKLDSILKNYLDKDGQHDSFCSFCGEIGCDDENNPSKYKLQPCKSTTCSKLLHKDCNEMFLEAEEGIDPKNIKRYKGYCLSCFKIKMHGPDANSTTGQAHKSPWKQINKQRQMNILDMFTRRNPRDSEEARLLIEYNYIPKPPQKRSREAYAKKTVLSKGNKMK